MTVTFTVPGTPVGKGRPRFQRRGNYVHTYTPDQTREYEKKVKVFAIQAMKGAKPIEGACSVVIELTVHPPESWSTKKKNRAYSGEIQPTTKPDLDNTTKLINDAMNDIVYLDDKQIVHSVQFKQYGQIAQALVYVRPFEGRNSMEKLSNLF